MSVSVEIKGNKVIVETDYAGSDIDHSMIQGDSTLIGAMRSFGINKVEGSKSGFLYSLHSDFDDKFKKMTGRSKGYIYPLE